MLLCVSEITQSDGVDGERWELKGSFFFGFPSDLLRRHFGPPLIGRNFDTSRPAEFTT